MRSNKLHETYIDITIFNSEGKRIRTEEVQLEFDNNSNLLNVRIYSYAFGRWLLIDMNDDEFKSKYTQEKIEFAIADYWMNVELDKMNAWRELQLKTDRNEKVG